MHSDVAGLFSKYTVILHVGKEGLLFMTEAFIQNFEKKIENMFPWSPHVL